MMNMPFESGFRIVSPWGLRTDPITGEANCWHGGVDLVGNDRNVRAVCSGTVIRSRMAPDLGTGDRTWEWGNYVIIAGADGRQVIYAHLDERRVEVGQYVSEGQILGIEGTTGRSTGIHLHFEVRDYNVKQLDPCDYLGIPNQVGYIWTPPAPEPEEDPWITQAHDWSREAVDWCVRRGILKGRGGDDYALGEPITREEMCVMFFRSKEVP